MIRIGNVPEALHRRLKSRAAQEPAGGDAAGRAGQSIAERDRR
jgi:hypothetical protein